jgi:hypothetical protein
MEDMTTSDCELVVIVPILYRRVEAVGRQEGVRITGILKRDAQLGQSARHL